MIRPDRIFVLFAGCAWLPGVSLLMVLLACPPVLSAELAPGTWTGSYQAYRSDPVNAEYLVRYEAVAEQTVLAITMILIDLEPRDNFTYRFEMVKLTEGEIVFQISKAGAVKQCKLFQQTAGEYVGTCQIDPDPASKRLSIIVMKPPRKGNVGA